VGYSEIAGGLVVQYIIVFGVDANESSAMFVLGEQLETSIHCKPTHFD